VCYRLANRRLRCIAGIVDGFDWNHAATDTRSASTRGLGRVTTFTWYVNSKPVAVKRVLTS
jgi:hypothetical protein